MVRIAMAAKRMPTAEDITIEIVKLINFDPKAAVYEMDIEISIAINIEPTFKNNGSTS